MLTAKKDNKVYDILKQDKQRYLDEGFDVYEDGELIQYSPKKKIEYNKYVELEKANAELVAKIEELGQADTKALTDEITSFKTELKKLQKENAELKKASVPGV